MEEKKILEMLSNVGAVITDSHIVYTSGKHGPAYVNKDAIYPHTVKTSLLGRLLADHFEYGGTDVVIAPVVGGVILSQWTAFHLTNLTGREVLSVYADKATTMNGKDTFVIKRGYDKLIYNKQVLVVEDVLNTGGSVRNVVRAVRLCGGLVVSVGAICNRGNVTPVDLGVRSLFSLVNISMQAWDEADCPLCAKGVPINTDVGKGREFLARKK